MTCATLAVAVLLAARGPIPFETEIDAALAETSAIYPVPKALVVAVISVESSFRPRAVSRAGARGLMQLMPHTARRVGVAERHLFNPAQNILGGVRLLAVLLRHYDGDVISALVAYNARPRKLFAPVPRNGETPAYVWRVLARARAMEGMSIVSPAGRGDTRVERQGGVLGEPRRGRSAVHDRRTARRVAHEATRLLALRPPPEVQKQEVSRAGAPNGGWHGRGEGHGGEGAVARGPAARAARA